MELHPIVENGRLYADVGMSTLLDVSPPDPDRPRKMSDDGYPDVIADARHGYGINTVAELELHWLDYLDRHNLEPWFDETLSAVPYVNRARWLTDCPSCNAGNWAWDQSPASCCLDCGLVYKTRWLAPTVRAAAVRLLAVRPIVNANWNVHKGETLDDLDRENRWLLDEPSVEKNGLVVPVGLTVPEALDKYADAKVT